jgi:hypothetical protein
VCGPGQRLVDSPSKRSSFKLADDRRREGRTAIFLQRERRRWSSAESASAGFGVQLLCAIGRRRKRAPCEEISCERAPRVDSGERRGARISHYRGFYGSPEQTKNQTVTNTYIWRRGSPLHGIPLHVIDNTYFLVIKWGSLRYGLPYDMAYKAEGSNASWNSKRRRT